MGRFAQAVGAIAFLLLAPHASAQSPTSTMRGVVRDASEGGVPSAVVSIVIPATGLTRTVTTDAEGAFVAPGLQPGLVDVTASAPGFGMAHRPGVLLEVGQTTTLVIELSVGRMTEAVLVEGGVDLVAVDTSRSVVDAVIPASLIDSLPLNGRNFLELSFLVPGNAPAPNFDPTKATSVIVSSAGQLGRGGNIMIDGADNNDDVVGGPLLNVPQESVQEFQIATNRFTAESGRSGSSVINVVTRSGSAQLKGSASLFARDHRFQALPAAYDRTFAEEPPFDRQQVAAAAGGPLVPQQAFWFGAVEYRNQDGAVLVGSRDVASRTIRRSFAPSPLDDLLASVRADWRPSGRDALVFRYAGQRSDDTSASTLDRAIGSAQQRQRSHNRHQSSVGTWTRAGSRALLVTSASFSRFDNRIDPVARGPQLTFPSLQDGTSFRVPQGTEQTRVQLSSTATLVKGHHTLRVGGEWQRVAGRFDLDVFREGRIEFVQDFATFDHNGDGLVDDGDLLFAVTLRSGKPDQGLVIDDADNHYLAGFVQHDSRIRQDLTLNLGLRYELDTDVKNISRVDRINPIVQPFLRGNRGRDMNNLGPRIGFNWAPGAGRTSVHGGYGMYYDRVTLQVQSLERGLDGRALPIEVRAGNVLFLDPASGRFPTFAPSTADPFSGFILPGAGASGINIIDNDLQNPAVQQFNLGVQRELPAGVVLRVDGVHNLGTHFIIGRTIGTVFNPVVGGPDRVVNLESSVNTKYDGLLVSAARRGTSHGFRAAYTLSKASNYANDDQIPFANGPIDPGNIRLEYGPTPNDQRHRLTIAAWGRLRGGLLVAPVWTVASGVPMDILMPDAQSRVPAFQRNAGARLFRTPAQLNAAIATLNAGGGIDGQLLPSVTGDARFSDSFNALDLRVSRPFATRALRVEPIVEVFNLFNVTNILGVSNRNYSGFSNVLLRDGDSPQDPGYLTSSRFGQPVTTAGGVFGSGGPRAFQLAVRVTF